MIANPNIDFGLGDNSRLDELLSVYENSPNKDPDYTPTTDQIAGAEQGKFKVSSLRNVGKTAPYGHNGYFATLKEIVHFYNTRDVAPQGTF